MGILMTYWNAVWRDAVTDFSPAAETDDQEGGTPAGYAPLETSRTPLSHRLRAEGLRFVSGSPGSV